MKTLTLSVPKSCHEQWNTFTPNAQGGYCSSCQKTVVDFTRMSDEEVIRFFSVKPSHSCGRFRLDQLKTYAEEKVVNINPGFTLLKAGFLSLVLILLSRPASSQSNVIGKTQTEIVQTSSYSVGNDTPVNDLVITGTVKDEANAALPGVNVLVRGTTQGTVTDADGRFQISAKAGDTLLFSFIGLDTQEYVVSEDAQNNLEITMTMSYAVLLGEVAVDRVYGENTSLISQFWASIRDLF